MKFNRVPVRQWKHREFDGADPWDADRPARWSIVTFRMVPESMVRITVCDRQCVNSERNDIPRKYAVGLYLERNGRYRIFPRAVAKAWRAGQVADQNLPRVLYEGEEGVRRQNDLPGPLAGAALRKTLLLGTAAVGMFGYYLWLVFTR